MKLRKFGGYSALFALALATTVLPNLASAQDQNQEDPPSRVARLGYMEGSVSFQPAGENDWVGAVDNRPMTTGDKVWADKDSRAELQLGSAVIRLSQNTGISFLNLDDRTAQVQLSSGSINFVYGALTVTKPSRSTRPTSRSPSTSLEVTGSKPVKTAPTRSSPYVKATAKPPVTVRPTKSTPDKEPPSTAPTH